MSSAIRALSNVDAGVVKAEIEIAATPARVFQSLTDASELAAWWGSDNMYRTSDWKVDLRPGGKWSALDRDLAAAGTGEGWRRVLEWLAEHIDG